MIKILFKTRGGESLIEVIAAMVIVVISISLAANLLLNSTDSTNINRDYLLAENLASEAQEAVANMFYSNIIKYGTGNLRDCFLTYQTASNGEYFLAEECENNLILDPVANRLSVESIPVRNYETTDLHWDISRDVQTNLDLTDPNLDPQPFRLYKKQIDNDNYIYTYEIAGNTASPYYRSVSLTTTADQPLTVEIVAKVQWNDGNKIHTVTAKNSLAANDLITAN